MKSILRITSAVANLAFHQLSIANGGFEANVDLLSVFAIKTKGSGLGFQSVAIPINKQGATEPPKTRPPLDQGMRQIPHLDGEPLSLEVEVLEL